MTFNEPVFVSFNEPVFVSFNEPVFVSFNEPVFVSFNEHVFVTNEGWDLTLILMGTTTGLLILILMGTTADLLILILMGIVCDILIYYNIILDFQNNQFFGGGGHPHSPREGCGGIPHIAPLGGGHPQSPRFFVGVYGGVPRSNVAPN
jgi:hypothetical protein